LSIVFPSFFTLNVVSSKFKFHWKNGCPRKSNLSTYIHILSASSLCWEELFTDKKFFHLSNSSVFPSSDSIITEPTKVGEGGGMRGRKNLVS
jgi:hypothetical protein